eukprot:GGOE01025093.1.p1 GENE.GGOE01025093.1~~GGOE01025093.1.p1  ORF type:complete len:791 (+),score=167.36 GGOE01025093.1:214-2586(+)
MALLEANEDAPKAVSFDLFKNDGFIQKGRAPPRALLARLNHPVAPNVQELRAQREAVREERGPEEEVPVPSSTRKRANRTVKVNSPKKASEGTEGEPAPVSNDTPSPKRDREPVAIGVGIGIEDQPQVPVRPPPELTEEQRQASAKMIAVFGEETVRGLHSQKWVHRMDSIKEVSSSMDTYKSSKRSVKMKMLEVFIQVASLLLFDSVLQVYLQSLEFLKAIVGNFASDVNPEVLREHVAPLIRVLLQRTGDMNSRICSAAVDFLMYLAALPVVGISHVSEYLTEPIENTLAFKHVIARLSLLLTVIGQYGFADEGGLSPEKVMAIVVDALNGTNPKVRKQAALIVVEAYKRLGKKTEQYLRSCKPATLKFLKTEIEVELCDIEALADADVKTQEQEDLLLLEAFEQEEQRKMQPLVDVFGPGIQCLFSKKWKLRENALDRLRQQLELGTFNTTETSSNGRNAFGSKKSFMHCCRVLMIGLSDPVPIVYTMSCGALRSALGAYMESISENDFKLGMENIITLLIGRSGDLNTSVKNVTVETLQAVATHEKVGVGFVGTYMLTPVDNLNQWRMVVARLELLEVFVQQFGFSAGGLSTEATMTFAVGTFQSANGKVRKAAVDLIVEVYKKAGNVVQTYLKNQKPALVNELKSKIMKIARKDRTKSAPIQRLANIVQPLGTDQDRFDIGKPSRPKTFPDTIGGLDETDTMTVRERVETWKKEKEREQQQRQVEYQEDGHVVVGQEKGRSKVSDANQVAARNMESMPGPGMKLSDDIVQGRPKKATIRGRMVFE